MRNKFLKSACICLILVVCILSVSVGCSKTTSTPTTQATATQKTGEITVGIILPLTGVVSIVAAAFERGIELYFDKVNAAGGLTIGDTTYTIKYFVEDGGDDPELARTAATKLIYQNKATYIFGGWIGASDAAITEVCAANKVAHVMPQHLVPHDIGDASPDKPWTMRAAVSLDASIPILMDVLKQKYPDAKKLGLMVADTYVDSISKYENYVKGMGYEYYTQIHSGTTGDYIPVATRCLAENPDAVVNPLAGMAFAILKAVRQLGFKGPFISTAPMGPDLFLAMAGPESCTDLITGGFDINQPNDAQKEIMDMWEAKYHEAFVSDSTMGWDAAWLIVQAMQKGQSVDPGNVLATLETMTVQGDVQTSFGPARVGGAEEYGINRILVRPVPATWVMDAKVVYQNYALSPWE